MVLGLKKALKIWPFCYSVYIIYNKIASDWPYYIEEGGNRKYKIYIYYSNV